MKTNAILMAILTAVMATNLLAAWTTPYQINQLTDGLQCTRDTDTPRAMAVDRFGNIHFVIETQSDRGDHLGIHYRNKQVNGIWGDEISITESEPVINDGIYNHGEFGHPSIIFNNSTRGIICYLMDNGEDVCYTREIRSRSIFLEDPNPFGLFAFMSEEGTPYLTNFGCCGIKVPVVAMDHNGVIYGFWPYQINSYYQVYSRIYFNYGWQGSEILLPAISSSDYSISSLDALADPAGNIHLVIAMVYHQSDASIEVYHCWYNVSTQTWSSLEPVSTENGIPDGYNSTLPYMAFSGGANNYVMHIVWEENLGPGNQVMYRSYNKYSETWNPQVVVKTLGASKPTVAVLPYGAVYVAYADIINGQQWLYYKYRSPETGLWSDSIRVDAEDDRTTQDSPFMITDQWGNLHISYLATNNPNNVNEIFYSKNDLPPLAPINLAAISNPSHPKFKWSPCTEPNVWHYKVYKSYGRPGNWVYEATTSDTIYTDMSVIMDKNNSSQIYYCIKTEDTLSQLSLESEALMFAYHYDIGLGRIAGENIPSEFGLAQNYPNPFNARTTIVYSLPQESDVEIAVYDITGSKIETIINCRQSPGEYKLDWNSKNLPSGVYFYKIIANDFIATNKMVLLK